MNIPIVMIIYHRPDLTKNIIDSLREVKPKTIYVIADGPRSSQDKLLCQQAREVINQINWNCNIHTHYAKKNMGLRKRVVSGLDYVFKREKWAIILEDDLLIDSSFYMFCDKLLRKYEKNEKIISISGNNFQFGKNKIPSSYYFSRYVHSWGWATWERAWKTYDDNLTDWRKLRNSNWLDSIFKSKVMSLYWKNIFDMVSEKQVDSWAYRWTYTSLINSKLTIIPNQNIVSNIGFGSKATHTIRKSKSMNNQLNSIIFPLKHPNAVIRNIKADKQTERVVYLNFLTIASLSVRSIIRSIFGSKK